MAESPAVQGPTPPASRRRWLALHWQILIGLALGMGAGLVANMAAPRTASGGLNAELQTFITNVAKPIGQVFLNLIMMVVIPLVFCALVLGVLEMGNIRKLGRVGFWCLILTVLLSLTSTFIGLGLVNTIRPGHLLPAEKRQELRAQYASAGSKHVENAQKSKPLHQSLLDIIPRNPLQEMVGALDGSSPGGGMLAVMFFALLFGVAMLLAPERTGPLRGVLEGIFDIMMVIIGFAMRIAPVAVAALMFALAAELGVQLITTLGGYVATVLAGLALHMLGVYSLLLTALARLNPMRFFRRIAEVIVTSFATSSSTATLPTSIRVTERNLGVRPEVGRFVLTVGATANQNGTALFEGITVLFLAQVFGIELSFGQQFSVAMLCILAGIGTAGVPGGSLPLIVLVLQSLGIPGEGIGIIVGVDRILDPSRTVVNVSGDIAIAACVDRLDRVADSSA